MLRQGPVDKNDGKPCQTWELTIRSVATHSHVQYHAVDIHKQLNQRSWGMRYMSKSMWTSSEKQTLVFVGSFKLQKLLSLSHFHLASILPYHLKTLLDKSIGPTPEHQSTNTTKLSQVSNATGTPLDPILFHHFKTCSHRPPCQAPGLGSFLANVVYRQVNVRQRFVDFQCFCEGLWTKTMANHAKHENHEKFKRDLRQHTALSTTTQLKSTNNWSKDREQIWGNQGELQLKRCSYFRLLVRYINHYSSSFKNALPIPLPSCFHPMFPCEGLVERSTRTPVHQHH